MHVFQTIILPLVEKELINHEDEIQTLLLEQIHSLITKFIAHVDKKKA